MGELSRRIEALERSYFSSGRGPGGQGQGPGGDERTLEFMRACLRAIAHVRRQPIDDPPWKYQTSKLYELDRDRLAAYTTALSIVGHEDEEEARLLLEAKLEGVNPGLRQLMKDFARRALRGS